PHLRQDHEPLPPEHVPHPLPQQRPPSWSRLIPPISRRLLDLAALPPRTGTMIDGAPPGETISTRSRDSDHCHLAGVPREGTQDRYLTVLSPGSLTSGTMKPT